MTEQELMEKIQHEVFKNYLKSTIENNIHLTRPQKEYQKKCVDAAAQQADKLQEVIKMMRTMGMM